jgi:hypothetical protein
MTQQKGLGRIPRGLEWIKKNSEAAEANAVVEDKKIEKLELVQELPEEQKKVVEPQKPVSVAEKDINGLQEISAQEPVIDVLENEILDSPVIAATVALEEIKFQETKQESKLEEQKVNSPEAQAVRSTKTTQKGLPKGWIRATVIMKEEHLEALKSTAYWDRTTIKQMIDEALTQYLSTKDKKRVSCERCACSST